MTSKKYVFTGKIYPGASSGLWLDNGDHIEFPIDMEKGLKPRKKKGILSGLKWVKLRITIHVKKIDQEK